jgi:hypothetical protein
MFRQLRAAAVLSSECSAATTEHPAPADEPQPQDVVCEPLSLGWGAGSDDKHLSVASAVVFQPGRTHDDELAADDTGSCPSSKPALLREQLIQCRFSRFKLRHPLLGSHRCHGDTQIHQELA